MTQHTSQQTETHRSSDSESDSTRPILALDCSCNACSVAVWQDGALSVNLFEPMGRGHSERLVPMIEEALEKASLTMREIGMYAVTTGPGGFTGIRLGLATAQGLQIATGSPVAGVTTLSALGIAAAMQVTKGRIGWEQGGHPTLYLALIDSKRGDVFAQAFVKRDRGVSRAAGDLTQIAPGVDRSLIPVTEAVGVPRDSVLTGVVQPAIEALKHAGYRPPFGLQVIGNLAIDGLESLVDGHRHLEIADVDVVSAEPDARYVAQCLVSAMGAQRETSAFGISDPVHIAADFVPPPLYIRPPDVSKPKTRTPRVLEAAGMRDATQARNTTVDREYE